MIQVREPDKECKSCNYLSKKIRGLCVANMDKTPNCPCKTCLVKPTCTISKIEECEKFNLHYTYYLGRK
jgi:hypothetical protein